MKLSPNAQRHKLQPLADKRVVVADPNQVTRFVLRDTAYQLGAASVSYCSSAIDVLRAVNGRDVHLILCEYRLDHQRDGQQLLEELRMQRLIPLSTIFMMVTGERAYRQVVAVAEFAPDDYLIKPFTPEQLRTRLVRANDKKHVFSQAYHMIETGHSDLAVHECKRLAVTHPRFFADAYRLGIDLLNSMERYEEAEELLAKVLALKAVPWAIMGLAHVRHKMGKPDEAEEVLHGLIATREEYLAAYDLLATVKEELGKDEEALEVLETASAISSSNVNRLRRTGETARRIGKLERAEAAFAQVVDRVRDSSMLEGGDFANLSGVLVQQGKIEKAQAVAADQRKMMRGHPEVEFVGKLMEYQHAMKDGDRAKAVDILDRLLTLFDNNAAPVAPSVQLQLLEACFQHDRADQGYQIASRIARIKGVERPVLKRVRELVDAHRKAPPPIKPLDFKGIGGALEKLARDGWNVDLAARVYDALVRGLRDVKSDGDEAELRSLLARYEALKANFGIVPDQVS